ncbi:MAG: hypothetical protein PHO07_10575 [Pirellulales bacterium]|nr:hypothetical protein [Pirellulales bacterium]
MRRWRIVWTPWAALACLGMLLPPSWAEASEPVRAKDDAAPIAVSDVALDTGGGMQGVVVDVHGMPRSGVEVALVQHRRRLSLAKTDLQRRFRLAGVKGGVYQIQTGGQGRFVRAWTAEAAPPAARPLALMVVGSEVVRGQMPLEDFFASDAVIITGLVAAMIAIPIAVNNSGGKDKPASP